MAQQGSRYKPTDADREFVERATKGGMTVLEIAEVLDIHDDTLRKHFRYELITARARLNCEAIRVVDEALADNSLDAAKYVLSRRATGWSETTKHEHSGGIDVGGAKDRLADKVAGAVAASTAAGGSTEPSS